MHHFLLKSKKNSGELGASTIPLWEGDTPSPHLSPRHLRRLNSRAFGARLAYCLLP